MTSALEDELQQLREQMQQKDHDIQLAAEIGNRLLNENKELEQHMDTKNREFTTRIENLEQERYAMQLQLNQKKQMAKEQEEEIEFLRANLKSQKKDFEIHQQAEQSTAISKLKKQVDTLRAEADQSQLTITQLREKCGEAEERAESLQTRLTEKLNQLNETCSEEMAQLHSEVCSLSKDKADLTSALNESVRDNKQLKLALLTAENRAKTLEAEVEEQQCQATSYYNALEKSREEVQELRLQLDMIRMETQDQKRKGNSLFAEVEDRRVEAEKELISYKVKYQMLEKQYKAIKENQLKQKRQMAAILQMSVNRADSHHLERVQEQLRASRAEVADLTQQLSALKTQQKSMEEDELTNWQSLLSQHCEQGYVQFVKALVEKKDKEIADAKADLMSWRLQEMANTDKIIECENKIYLLEQKSERQMCINLKQRTRIDELEAKYEPGKPARQVQWVAEKIPTGKTKEAEEDDEVFVDQEDKENGGSDQSKHPDLELPAHLQQNFHKEVIDPNAFQKVPTPTRKAHPLHVGRAVPLSKAPKTGKKVTLSDDVDVVHLPPPVDENGENMEPPSGGPKKRGGRVVANPIIKVSGGQPVEECQVQ